MKTEDKVFVVTGAGNGMGREIALNLVMSGARVAAVDLNENALNETKQMAGSLGKKISIHRLNITDWEAVGLLPREVIRFHGHIDAIIHNAGSIQTFVKMQDLRLDNIHRVMDINFYGTLALTKAFLP